jgi:hypothetical protein
MAAIPNDRENHPLILLVFGKQPLEVMRQFLVLHPVDDAALQQFRSDLDACCHMGHRGSVKIALVGHRRVRAVRWVEVLMGKLVDAA